MEAESVRQYFEKPAVAADYARAAEEVGLWKSEEIVFTHFLNLDMAILELGCGAGRASLGLAELGYKNITASDFSTAMVEAAREIFERRNVNVSAIVADATNLQFANESFDAVIFAFNGFMQIPQAENREQAAREINRVLKDSGFFIFTTHDRSVEKNKDYWDREQKQWSHNCQDPRLDDFGDIVYKGAHGNIFIHSPITSEIRELLQSNGFEILLCQARSSIAQESESVEDFSDDCLFWVAKKSKNHQQSQKT